MPKQPRKRIKEEKASNLLEALKFCKLVTKSEGPPNETHVILQHNWAKATNGIVSCGHKIDEDIFAIPNSDLITNAISKSGNNFAITLLDKNKISIKSEKFKAIVPCLTSDMVQYINPDSPVAAIDNRFREAVSIVSVLASETAQSVILASVLMAGSSIISTNRVVMLEAWHGIDLPQGITLPKTFCNILSKTTKNLKSFGYSNSSATFYFEDDSWIKTQYYAEPWPNVSHILNRPCNLFPLPKDFYSAIDAVAPFSENGDIYFGKERVQSHESEEIGAIHECPGIPKGPIFNYKQLKLIEPYIEQVDFVANGALIFIGNRVRGAIAGRN